MYKVQMRDLKDYKIKLSLLIGKHYSLIFRVSFILHIFTYLAYFR
jgi:hypothetical protein